MTKNIAITALVLLSVSACADSGSTEAPLQTATFALDAGGDNTPPEAVDDAFEVEEDGEVLLNVLDNDVDADADPLTVFVADNAQDGILETLGNGEFRYIPRSDFNGTDSFTYGVLDGQGGSGEATVTITVTPTNDAPRFVPPTPSNGALLDVVAAAELRVPLAAGDIDGDRITLAVGPLNTTTQPVLANSELLWTPGIADIGRHTVVVSASDGTLEDTREFSVNVTGQADTPCGATICTSGQSCYFGLCVDPCVTDLDCPDADRCFAGRCASEACENRPCADDESCTQGGCFRRCAFDGECFAGQRCFGGRCAESACTDIVCAVDELCAGGSCRFACSADPDCVEGSCINGGCAVDACDGVLCPDGQVCDQGSCVGDAAAGPMTAEESSGCASIGAEPSLLGLLFGWFVWRRR